MSVHVPVQKADSLGEQDRDSVQSMYKSTRWHQEDNKAVGIEGYKSDEECKVRCGRAPFVCADRVDGAISQQAPVE